MSGQELRLQIALRKQQDLARRMGIAETRIRYLMVTTGKGNTFPIKVTGKLSGRTYYVDTYKNGAYEEDNLTPKSPTQTGEIAVQLQIDLDHVIRTDTWEMGTKIGGIIYMQVPVWIERT